MHGYAEGEAETGKAVGQWTGAVEGLVIGNYVLRKGDDKLWVFNF